MQTWSFVLLLNFSNKLKLCAPKSATAPSAKPLETIYSMGFFDIFKKRKTDHTFPENELERCLMEARSSTSAQKEFYQKLLWNQLIVLTAPRHDSHDTNSSDENMTTVRLVSFENGFIPVFTSQNRIFDNGVVREELPCIGMKGQDLFGVASGNKFIINPYSEYRKEMHPEEIEKLLNGTIYESIDEQDAENKKNDKFNALFKQACARQEGLVFLDGYRRKSLTSSDKLQLEESVRDFKSCLNLVPDHWQSMTLMAKSLQRLERHSEALEQLERAFKIELKSHLIPMEAALEAMHIKNIDKALFYSEESLKRKPNDFALLGNHAMNLLIAERDTEAKSAIEKAIRIQPRDEVNRNIESMIHNVLSGKRKRPTFEDTIK